MIILRVQEMKVQLDNFNNIRVLVQLNKKLRFSKRNQADNKEIKVRITTRRKKTLKN